MSIPSARSPEMANPPTEPSVQRFAAACAEILRSPTLEGVYVGPLWEIPSNPPREGVRGWKMSVLRRRLGGGAENWGHLFLIVCTEGKDPTIGALPGGWSPGGFPRSAMEGPRILERGPPRVLLYQEPNRQEYGKELRDFVSRVASRFPS